MRTKNAVVYELDPRRPAPLTVAQKAELAALAAPPDDQIDASDMPPLSETFWQNAVRPVDDLEWHQDAPCERLPRPLPQGIRP